jgi:putative ABC transport system substrate-binding protein
MDRRAFLSAVAGTLVAAPFARAQQPGKMYRIGYVNAGAASAPELLAAFLEAMRQLGWMDGKNFTLEQRFADNRVDRLPDLALELVGLNADVILTTGTLAALAVKRATTTIPVVIIAAGDPVGSGLVPNLARPGGNITGTSLNSPELAGKRLQLLKEILPGISTVAVLWNDTNPYSALVFKETESAGHTLGTRVVSVAVRNAGDVSSALETAVLQRLGALVVVEDPFNFSQRHHIVELAARNRLPVMYGLREFLDVGGLMSYGAHVTDLFRRAATYVDKILRGAKPGDLPIEQPTKFELVISLKAAKALGLTIPQSVLLRADEVIQ